MHDNVIFCLGNLGIYGALQVRLLCLIVILGSLISCTEKGDLSNNLFNSI